MPIEVEVPGTGIIEFPDSMQPAEITASLNKQFRPAAAGPRTPRTPEQPQSRAEPTPEPSMKGLSAYSRFRMTPLGRKLLGPSDVERQGMAERGLSPQPTVQDIAGKMLEATSLGGVKPLAEGMKEAQRTLSPLTYLPRLGKALGAGPGTQKALSIPSGVSSGVTEAVLGFPMAPMPGLKTKSGAAILGGFGAQYLASQPEQYKAFKAALDRGDYTEATKLLTTDVTSGVLLGVAGREAGKSLLARTAKLLPRATAEAAKGEPNAVQERSAAPVPLGEAPGGRGEVGARAPRTEEPAQAQGQAAPVAKEASLSLSADRARYDELQSVIKKAVQENKIDTPETQAAFKEMEAIKNKNGGMPPYAPKTPREAPGGAKTPPAVETPVSRQAVKPDTAVAATSPTGPPPIPPRTEVTQPGPAVGQAKDKPIGEAPAKGEAAPPAKTSEYPKVVFQVRKTGPYYGVQTGPDEVSWLGSEGFAKKWMADYRAAQAPSAAPAAKPVPAPAPPAGGAKQPWQMTRAEYIAANWQKGKDRGLTDRQAKNDAARRHKIEVLDAAETGENVPANVLADYPDAKPMWAKRKSEVLPKFGPVTTSGEAESQLRSTQEVERTHRASIEQALREGKPVPTSVLADYPDLKPPSAAPPAKPVPAPVTTPKSLTASDVDDTKPTGWTAVTSGEAADPKAFRSKLESEGLGRVFGGQEKDTKRVVAMTDAQGKVHLVSVYTKGAAVRIFNPSTGTHQAMPKILEAGYKPISTGLLKDGVRDFHQQFDSVKAFEEQFGQEARQRAGQAVQEAPAVGSEEGKPVPVVVPPERVEKGEVIEHILKYQSEGEAMEGLKSSPDKARLKEALYTAMEELQARNPKLTPEQSLQQAWRTFYEQAQSVRRTKQPGVPAVEGKLPQRVRGTPGAPQGPTGISAGPGAASPGDVPLESQLTQLSRAIRGQSISPRESLSERIKNAVDAAGRWARGKDRVTQALAKMTGAKEALVNGYMHLPKWTDFTATIGRWSRADQESADQVAVFQKAINGAVPNKLRQEAITNWIQANGDEAVLRQRAGASKPAARKGYELALTLNDAEKTLARNIQSYLESRLEEGIRLGLLKQGVENYVTQVWKRPTSATQRLWADLFGPGTLNPNFRYARKRIFESYFEGEQAGFIPKDKRIGHLLAVYDLAFNRALSARAVIKELHEGKARDGLPITVISGKPVRIVDPQGSPGALLVKPHVVPEGAVSGDGRPYIPIDHWALRDWKWAAKDEQGRPVFYQGDMLVHPDHWRKLNNALKSSWLRANPITRALLAGQSIVKQTKLSLSPFHFREMAVHGLAHRIDPTGFTKPLAQIDFDDPIQQSLIEHGLMVRDPSAHELFAEGASGGGLVKYLPGIGQMQLLHNELLFKEYIPRAKMTMAMDALARNRAAYAEDIRAGKITDDQVLALTAREANAAFGEQNYRMMGRNPTIQDFLRLGTLAPDFMESRFRFVAQALKPYGREQRLALGLMAAGVYVVARTLNKAADDNYHWFDHPFSVRFRGRWYTMRNVASDFWHLITEPGNFVSTRLSPLVKIADELRTSRNDMGIKRDSAEKFADIASWLVAIPLEPQPGESAVGHALAATGITSRSGTKASEVYQMLDNWRSKQTDPKIKAAYDQHRKETLAPSPYAPLRQALQMQDDSKANRELQKLKADGHQSQNIIQALSYWKPMTGSWAMEQKFRQSLTPEEKTTYNEAMAERKAAYQRFLRIMRGRKAPLRQAAE